MPSLSYILKRSFINSIKKHSKKPSAYAVIAGIMIYFYVIGESLFEFLLSNTPRQNQLLLFGVMVFFTFISHTAGLHSIAKQKAVLFKTADVHFAFSAPINPKSVLIYAYARNIFITVILCIALFGLGIFIMHLPLEIVFMVVMALVLMQLIETSIIIIVYGKQDGSGTISKIISIFIRSIFTFLLVYFLYMYFIENIGLDFTRLINNPFIFLLPFVGWAISLLYVILVDTSVVALIGSVLFIISVCVTTFYAYRLTTQGDFYEEASSFAEEYAQMKKRAKKGESQIRWKKRKLRKASIHYKGTNAKAILYRQILEYKKQRFMIFGVKSLINVLISCMIAYFGVQFMSDLPPVPIPFSLILIGIMAYVSLLSSGYATKWTKEIDIIYTFMLPDTALKKLWYSTIIEHLRSLIDGILFVVPAALAFRFGSIEMILCIAVYIVLETSKLYIQIICQTVMLNIVGKMLANIIYMLILFGVVYGGGILITVFFSDQSIEMMLLSIIIYGLVISFVTCIIASTQFERMESIQ